MLTETDLLARGYLPRELPPTFVSTTFASAVAANPPASQGNGANWWTVPTKHNLARAGGLRRTLSIPNPSAYIKIANRVASAWHGNLAPLLAQSAMAGSKLVTSTGPRAVEWPLRTIELDAMRASKRQGARYLLRADVQNFYPSIYTHSIDWMVHGKAAAKAAAANKTKTIGSELDRMFRGSQDGQTIGIAIGPDASLIIAECIMARIEEYLLSRIPNLSGYRFWDDFELSFGSLADAESGMSVLQEALSMYELTLNPKKTKIIPLPDALLDPGVFEFGIWDLNSPGTQRRQLLGYFDQMFRCIAAKPGSPVAAYAIARLRSAAITPKNWQLVQQNLLQLLVVEPSCARFVAEIIGRAAKSGNSIGASAIAKSVELLATKHAPLGHGSEIAWGIWICTANNVQITAPTAAAISTLQDNVVALLTLHARAAGLVQSGLNTNLWESFMQADELRDSNWLLAYEASVKGWLPTVGGLDYVANDPFFSHLRQHNVEFYEVKNLALGASVPQLSGGGGIGGGY